MNRTMLVARGLLFLVNATLVGAVERHPSGVNVNSSGATTIFITFGALQDQESVEAVWCGELIPAAPDIGLKCDERTLFGALPQRYDLSKLSSDRKSFTDVMSIPPSVARRAYQAAEAGAPAEFFYVRRFTRPGGPDEYVFVKCRLTGGGARVPLSLVDVRLSFDSEDPVLAVQPGEGLPPVRAEILYTGTGTLKGRWEAVLPGEELPTRDDLLSEAALPVEQRGLQRRYTPIARFNIFLPPSGRVTLRGPDVSLFPRETPGLHLILLRVEASDDKEADSDQGEAGAGRGIVHAGGVAGFAIPPLRYYVGSAGAETRLSRGELQPLLPLDDALIAADASIDFSWTQSKSATLYRIEVEDLQGQRLLSALIKPDSTAYRAPPWLKDMAAGGAIRWRIAALGPDGDAVRKTGWRKLGLDRRP